MRGETDFRLKRPVAKGENMGFGLIGFAGEKGEKMSRLVAREASEIVVGFLVLAMLASCVAGDRATMVAGENLIRQPALETQSVPLLNEDGYQFKDLNRDNELNPYEDWRLPAADRASDLVSRMTLQEKAGMLLHGSMSVFGDDDYDMEHARRLILDNQIGSVITRLASRAELLAAGNNKLQALAEQRRLGIPLSISTDPRNHFNYLAGASISAGSFSQWPEALGLAAIGDPELVRQFANIARQEYRAVGIVQALSPMADLATEPRWPRVAGTFGEDAELAKVLVGAYVEGFQNGDQGLGPDSVAAVVKHWVGYGAAKDGHDSHSYFGRFAAFPGNNFDYHMTPFEAAFDADVSGVMPTYSILENLVHEGESLEQVGAGFNRYLLTDLLRGRYGFEGVVLSDWAITLDCDPICVNGEVDGQIQDRNHMSTAWGVIELTQQQRYEKALYAGIDQFGGVEDPQSLIEAVTSGLVAESRLNESAHRILVQKFQLGVFENPFVDDALAREVVGNESFIAQAEAAQSRALVLLENKDDILPLSSTAQKVFLYGIDSEIAASLGFTVVENVEEADLAIVRLTTPYEQPHKNYMFGRRHHEGNLAFKAGNPEYDVVVNASAHVPVIATVFLERPAVMTPIQDSVAALIGNFGVSDKVLFEVLLGEAQPEGRLPIELPRSMAAVENQAEDLPFDTEAPLYPFGYGLSYQSGQQVSKAPNIVVLFADDLGFGDLSSYGHPSIETPQIDRLATQGQRWTDFYVASPVCSPSRGALLTGNYPLRSGLYGNKRSVLFPNELGAIPPQQLTLPEALKDAGYATAMFGKWHLGDQPDGLPTRHGFDEWYGVPYSNDMDWAVGPTSPELFATAARGETSVVRKAIADRKTYSLAPKREYWNIPLIHSSITAEGYRDEELERPADQSKLTGSYTQASVDYIARNANSDRPFFLYVAYAMPHVPLFPGDDFLNTSRAGRYGDVVEEIDWSVGRIRAALEEAGVAENTLVVFTSDNGPWLTMDDHGGSAGPLRDGKGTTYEGGVRVPGIFWWPGTIEPGVVHGIGSVMDIYATSLSLAGAKPNPKAVDTIDLSPALFGAPSPRDSLAFYRQDRLYAFRQGPHKIHLMTEGAYGRPPSRTTHEPPLLFHLGRDPGEKFDIAAQQPGTAAELLEAVQQHQSSMTPAAPIFDLGRD